MSSRGNVRLERTNWNFGESSEGNLRQMAELKSKYDAWLSEHIGHGFLIDEVALLVPSEEMMLPMVKRLAGTDGVSMFNHARDSVKTEPFNSKYAVEYSFFSTTLGFRIELMNMVTGISPLHLSILNGIGERPTVVHASFKCDDVAQYDSVLSSMCGLAQHGQTCTSTYGVFSYWLPFGVREHVYLKPRVNLRDEVLAAIDNHFEKVGGGVR